MTNLERALLVAERVHANQLYDIYPYMYHIRSVVGIAQELGYDESIQIACALHDSMEDGALSYKDIHKGFGYEVAEIVYCVTDELGRNRKEKKEKTYPKIRSLWKAVIVKICDRVANMKQSKTYNPNKWNMYVNEHDDFSKNIHNPEHDKNEMQRAWDKLNSTING